MCVHHSPSPQVTYIFFCLSFVTHNQQKNPKHTHTTQYRFIFDLLVFTFYLLIEIFFVELLFSFFENKWGFKGVSVMCFIKFFFYHLL